MADLYTPVMGDIMGEVGDAMTQRAIGKNLKGAFMGDQAAMESLMQLDPKIGADVQTYRDKQAQIDLENQRKEEDRRQQFAVENRELMEGIMEDISYFEDFEQAAAFADMEVEQMRELGLDVPDMQLTPEVFEQIKLLQNQKLASQGITTSTPREYEYTDPETNEKYMARAVVQTDKRGGMSVKYVMDPVTKKPMKAMAGQSAEQAADVAGAKKRAQIEAEIDLADEKAIADMSADAKVELIPARKRSMQTLGIIEQLRNHPGRSYATGIGWLNPFKYAPGTDAHNFMLLADQAQGKVFAEAYETLKGGGQITEIESKKAEQAIARMETSASQAEYLAALDEFEQATRDGYAKLLQMASTTPEDFIALMQGELAQPLPETGQVNRGTMNNPARPTSKAEYDALPSGAYYVKDGKTRRKK